MIEQSVDQRIGLWLEMGPTELPEETVQAVFAAVRSVRQQRPLRLAGRPVPFSGRGLLAAAAAVVIFVAGGAYLLRSEGPDVATQRQPADLLYEFPDATTFLERTGGPATAGEVVSIGGLPGGRVFVVVASCTGGDAMAVGVYFPSSVQVVPSGGGEAPAPTQPAAAPMEALGVPCNGSREHLMFRTDPLATEDPFDLRLTAGTGAIWRVSVGEYPGGAVSRRPAFPALRTTEGWYLLTENGEIVVTGRPGPLDGIGIEVPAGATGVAVLVQCSGKPIILTSEVAGPTEISCDDPSRTTRVEYPAEGTFTVFAGSAGSDGPTWVRLAAEANGAISPPQPTAPPMPAAVSQTGFAETDGSYLALGRIGSNEQALILVPGAAGIAGGDFVGVTVPEPAGGMRLDLYSISRATLIRTLARVTGQNHFRSWVDATHRQVFYEVFNADFSVEWRRVAFDGSDDVVVAASAPNADVLLDADLAIDDSAFLVDMCPGIPGSCRRVIFDTATRESREVAIEGDRTCQLIGVVDGLVVARTAPTCDVAEPGQTTVQDLAGGPRRILVDGPTAPALGDGQTTWILVMGSAGPQVVYARIGETRSTYSVVSLAGGDAREVAAFDYGNLAPRVELSAIRLPAGDWILLAGPLGDTPNNQRLGLGRAVPVLLNIVTGEQIELVNLPHSAPGGETP